MPFSPQRLQVSPRFFRCNVPLWGPYTAPLYIRGRGPTFGGQAPPTENLHFWTVTFFVEINFPKNWPGARGTRAPSFRLLPIANGVFCWEKIGVKFLGVFKKSTCGAIYRKFVTARFRARQTIINAVGTMSKSTSGPEL